MRDRQLEEDERKAFEQESEEFLKKQLAEMAELEQKQRKAGLLTEDAAPIKLAIGRALPEHKEEKPDIGPVKARPSIMLDGDDEEEDPANKKKRTLVKLEYDQGPGLTEAEKVATRNAKLLDIRSQVPKEKKRLWAMSIEWAAMNEVSGFDRAPV